MKKIFVSVLVICFILNDCICSVRADAIIEPRNNFYERHKEECTYVSRHYKANGDIKTWDAPNGNVTGDTLKDGENLHILFQYTDKKGIDWGVLGNQNEQWVLIADTILVYDSKQFQQDYADEILEDTVQTIPEGTELLFWTYPLSGKIAVAETSSYMDLDFSVFYTDEEERLWGYCAYYMGHREVWVCLSDLNNENIQAKEVLPDISGQNLEKEKMDAVRKDAEEGSTAKMLSLVAAVLLLSITAGSFLLLSQRKRKIK